VLHRAFSGLAPRLWLALAGVISLVASGPSAHGAQVRGVLEVEPRPFDEAGMPPLATHAQIRVAQPARGFRTESESVALFLQVESSLPLPEPTQVPEVRVRGFTFEPSVVSCPVDGKVAFINDGPRTFALAVGGAPIGTLEARGRVEMVCQAGAGGATLLGVTVAEQPFMTAQIYVGEVGISAVPDETGAFSMSAPKGTYQLLLVSRRGVVSRRPVEVRNRDVDLGVLVVPADGSVATESEARR